MLGVVITRQSRHCRQHRPIAVKAASKLKAIELSSESLGSSV